MTVGTNTIVKHLINEARRGIYENTRKGNLL